MNKLTENNNSIFIANGGNRPLNVRMTLRDVLYVSYAVPAEKIRVLVPDILSVATSGDKVAFISIVALRSSQVRLNLLPFARFHYNQLNIRTYVVDPVSGKHAVYFIKSGVTSRFISMATRISGIPWQLIDMETELNAQNDTGSYVTSGKWGDKFSLKARADLDSPEQLLFFGDRESAVEFLIRPLIGFVGDNQKLGRFTIGHPEVKPQVWYLSEIDFKLFADLGVVNELMNPHSVFFLPAADFSIYLPPARIKQKGG